MATETWSDGTEYVYFYNAEGNLAKKVDTGTGCGVNYEYDSLGRLIRSAQTDGTSTLQRTEHLYDTSNRISSQSWQLGSTVYTESYTYDEDDGSLKSMQPAVGGAMSFEYDALKRLHAQENSVYRRGVAYEKNADGTASTRVESIGYSPKSSSVSGFTLYHDYDALGNIIAISSTSADFPGYNYTYDAQGQMTRETIHIGSSAKTYNYTYDTYGNIRSVSGGESHTYTYGNDQWRDLLTAYDGHSISYDEIGNPETYYNGKDWSFTWQKGRQLASAASGTTTAAYTYDLNGIRTRKVVNGVEYNFLTQNGKVVRQTWGDNFMDFIYDNTGRPYAIVNGNSKEQAVYYFILNQQGDVIRILGPNNTVAATYAYNAWGEVISSSGWMANQNPIRYRGYYYDNETGFYYLGSRYYDPSIGRFINADETSNLAANGDFTSLNLFAYCGNNPVSRSDNGGEFWHLVVGGVIGGIIGAISSAASGGDALDVLIGATAGAAGGVLAASGAGVVAQAFGSAAISMVSNAASQAKKIINDETGKTKFDVGDMLFDGAVSLACGAWGGNGASYGNSGGITAAGKQLFKRGFFNSQARSYYAKVAHNMGGEYVFKPLLKSLGKSALGAAVVTAKNNLKNNENCKCKLDTRMNKNCSA